MLRQTVKLKGKTFVLVEPSELRRLEQIASRVEADELPPLPPTNAHGNRPAVAFARASIARSVVTERRALGLTQEALAKLSGIRQETLSRLESGKHSPTIRTVQKIESALQRVAAKRAAK